MIDFDEVQWARIYDQISSLRNSYLRNSSYYKKASNHWTDTTLTYSRADYLDHLATVERFVEQAAQAADVEYKSWIPWKRSKSDKKSNKEKVVDVNPADLMKILENP